MTKETKAEMEERIRKEVEMEARLRQLEEKAVVKPTNGGLNAIAVICAFFFPGLGHAIKGHLKRGATTLLAAGLSFILMIFLIGFIILPIVWIINMYEAYVLRPASEVGEAPFFGGIKEYK